jgi:hypothetical protein
MAQVIGDLLSKYEALSSNVSPAKRKKGKETTILVKRFKSLIDSCERTVRISLLGCSRLELFKNTLQVNNKLFSRFIVVVF